MQADLLDERLTTSGREFVDELVGRASAPSERRSDWMRHIGGADLAARWQAWLRGVGRTPDDADDLLTRRGLDEMAFKTSLDHHHPRIGAERPSWATLLGELVEAVQRPPSRGYHESISIGDVAGEAGPPSGVDPSAPWPWLPFLTPILELAEAGLQNTLDEQTSSFARDLRLALIRRLNQISIRILIAPLTAADVLAAAPTTVGPNLLAVCLHPLGPRGWLGVWRAYPGLARLQATIILHWRRAVDNLLAALSEDRARIEAAFGEVGAEPIGVLLDQGDTHDGGQAVAIVVFPGRKLVWKPRDPGPAELWGELVEHINPHLTHPLRTAAIAVAPGRAWQEFIIQAAPRGEQEVAAYFWRIGATARLLQALGSVDFHGENLIATADGPVLIDLETLLAPIPHPGPSSAAERLAADILHDTPARSGIISVRAHGDAGRRGIEVGGIAPRTDQRSPTPAPQLRMGEDTPRFDWAFHRVRPGTALPPLPEAEMVLATHIPSIEEGYLAADAALAKLGEAWLPRDIGRLAIRHIVRPTRIYARLIAASLEPTCLRDGVLRELALERLWAGRFDVPVEAIDHELACLRDLDIPTYRVHASSTTLLFGNSRAEHYFSRPAQPGTTPFRKGPDALRAVLFARQPLRQDVPTAAPSETPDLHAAVRELADLLVAHAIEGGGDVTWISLQWDPRSDGWALGQMDDSSHNGRAGVARALRKAGEVLSDGALVETADRVRLLAAERLGGRLRAGEPMMVDLGQTLRMLGSPSEYALLDAAGAWFDRVGADQGREVAADVVLAMDGVPGGDALTRLARGVLTMTSPAVEPVLLESTWSEPFASRYLAEMLASPDTPFEETNSERVGDLLARVRFRNAHNGKARPDFRLKHLCQAAKTLAQTRTALEVALALGDRSSAHDFAARLVASRARDNRWFPDLLAPDVLFLGGGFGISRLLSALASTVAAS